MAETENPTFRITIEKEYAQRALTAMANAYKAMAEAQRLFAEFPTHVAATPVESSPSN